MGDHCASGFCTRQQSQINPSTATDRRDALRKPLQHATGPSRSVHSRESGIFGWRQPRHGTPFASWLHIHTGLSDKPFCWLGSRTRLDIFSPESGTTRIEKNAITRHCRTGLHCAFNLPKRFHLFLLQSCLLFSRSNANETSKVASNPVRMYLWAHLQCHHDNRGHLLFSMVDLH